MIQVKEKIFQSTGVPVTTQRLFARNCELENNRTLESYNILRKGKNRILLIHKRTLEGMNAFIEPYGDACRYKVTSSISRILDEINKGMALGLSPQLAFDGTAGTYQMRDQNRTVIAIFKPIDEEAYAPNNPRGFVGDFGQKTFRNGVLSGEGVIREVASYLIDHEHFSYVPPTIFAEVMHPSFNWTVSQEIDSSNFGNTTKQYRNVITSLIEPNLPEASYNSTGIESSSSSNGPKIGLKYGSLQYFVRADDAASNFSSDLFSVDEVHKIGILDLRIMNLDRNDGNLLVKKHAAKENKKSKYEYQLIPIDHSLSIPDNLEVYSYDICWMDWEQSHSKFSPRSFEYIGKIDVLKDVRKLDNTFRFRKICLRNIRITGTLLKKGAMAGLTLHQIGSILCREDDYDDEPELSVLEKIVDKAQEMAKSIRRIKNTQHKNALDSVVEKRTEPVKLTSTQPSNGSHSESPPKKNGSVVCSQNKSMSSKNLSTIESIK